MEMIRYDPTRQVGLFQYWHIFIATEVFRVADDSTGHLPTYMLIYIFILFVFRHDARLPSWITTDKRRWNTAFYSTGGPEKPHIDVIWDYTDVLNAEDDSFSAMKT